MSLLRQIYIGLSLAFVLILVAIEYAFFTNANVYLQRQLVLSTQESATALSLSLAQALESKDNVSADIIVTAVFDSGYYQAIKVISTKGETLIDKRLKPNPHLVPSWFTNIATLQASTEEALITSGWRQLGRVLVTGHANFGYLTLWHASLEFLYWLTVIYAVSLFALDRFLRHILRPLKDIESVATAISNHDFQQIKQIPKAPELRSVVATMNRLSEGMRSSIEFEINRANQFRDKLYTDGLTALGNRRHFEEYLRARLGENRDAPPGVLIIIALAGRYVSDFDQSASKDQGRGDELLQLTGKVLTDFCQERQSKHESTLARMGGATFGAVFFDLSRDEAGSLCSALGAEINRALAERRLEAPIKFACGGAYFESGAELGGIMARADMAMLQSGMHDCDQAVLLTADDGPGNDEGSNYWQKMIRDRIAGNKFALFAQPVMSLQDNRTLQFEVMGRIKDDQGRLVSAAQFMAMATRGNVAADVDRKLIEKLIESLHFNKNYDADFAVNLSAQSIRDREFPDWLVKTLLGDRSSAQRLVFEIPEFCISEDARATGNSRWLSDVSTVKDFVTRLHLAGARFAIDNFGLHRQGFNYLKALKPDYIKLNIALIGELSENLENQNFISSIVKVGQVLGIKTIATCVESMELLPLLKQLGVDGYQGYANGMPLPIDGQSGSIG